MLTGVSHGALSYFKTPLTDLTGTPAYTSQYFGLCMDIEMKMINCLEAYGYYRGVESSCKDIIDDYSECFTRFKQMARHIEIRKVQRQKKSYIEPPRPDCY
ncbi:unnamed protein product [Nezara viridula]|uniref:NADH-ubiquinone oxidoreductase 15 kDa subunit n=1 Tax=Nezara viridula TaxID=85310 RepID=A0A9P0MUM0_NEZVI|nr:unnamed protein product [Nezara viridula]